MNIKIIVATHKKYWMPSDPVYFPIHVGAEGKKDPGRAAFDQGPLRQKRSTAGHEPEGRRDDAGPERTGRRTPGLIRREFYR